MLSVPLRKLPFKNFSDMTGDLTTSTRGLERPITKYANVPTPNAVKLQRHIEQHADKKVNPFCRACVELSK